MCNKAYEAYDYLSEQLIQQAFTIILQGMGLSNRKGKVYEDFEKKFGNGTYSFIADRHSVFLQSDGSRTVWQGGCAGKDENKRL